MLEMDIKTYAKHARIWRLYGPDDTEEHEYWRKYAEQFGKNILIPGNAVGAPGVYMAKCGMNVTAFDITPEMVEEGTKRFGDVENFKLLQGDVRNFSFDIEPVDFCYDAPFGYLWTIEDIKKALMCINRHMRKGGCLIIPGGYREQFGESNYFPPKRFDLGEVLPGVKAWKIGETRNDAETGRCYISQQVYIEEHGNVETFDHSFYLQGYYREEWISALNESGFELANEYKNREKEICREGDWFMFGEAIKL
jgi:SAM-dependent methyltransferase